MYFKELREKIIEQDNTISNFKKELQRLYAPKVKIILQSIALQDNSIWDPDTKKLDAQQVQKLLA